MIRVCLTFLRSAIVVLLLAMLPIALMMMAAAGPTLADHEDGVSIAVAMLVYLVADAIVLFCLARFGELRWPWVLAIIFVGPPLVFGFLMVR